MPAYIKALSMHHVQDTIPTKMRDCGIKTITKLLLVFEITMCIRSAPVTYEVRLLSTKSLRFVQILENGTIYANGRLKQATTFYMYLKNNNHIEFEMKNQHGRFLMLKKIPIDRIISSQINNTEAGGYNNGFSYILAVGYTSESNFTSWVRAPGYCMVLSQILNDSTTCKVAFDANGNVIGPCRAISDDCIEAQRV